MKKLNKFFSLLIAVCLLVSLVPSMAFAAEAGESFTDGLFTYKVNADGATVTLTAIAADKLSGEVVIPSTVTDGVKNYTVTILGGAFKNVGSKTSDMTKLIMADTITNITVTAAFYGCRFTEVHLSSGLTHDVTGKGYLTTTFTECNLLTTVNIPAGVTMLYGTFVKSPSIKNVILEGTAVRTLFMDNSSAQAFANGAAINFYVPYVETPSSLINRMGSKMTANFYYYEGDYCYSVKADGTAKFIAVVPGRPFGETVVIPETLGGKTVSELYLYNFRNNKVTKNFTMPDTVTTIDSGTFYGWGALESVHLSDALTSGGAAGQMTNTFRYCTKLKSVEIPAGITKFYGTFLDNSAVRTVTLKTTAQADFYAGSSTTAARAWADGITGITIYYPHNGVAPTRITGSFTATAVKMAAPQVIFESGDFKYKVIDGTETVMVTGFSATAEKTGAMTVPASVTYENKEYAVTAIGNQAFNGASNVTSMTLPNTITIIGYQAFMNMTGLTSFDMPDSVTTIGYGTFYACSNLETVKLSKNLKDTMQTTFAYCSKLKDCVIPEGVTTLNRTFIYCNIINTVYVPATVTKIIGDATTTDANGVVHLNGLFTTFTATDGTVTGAPTEPGFAVLGVAGSAIETYMNGKGWTFKAIDIDMPLAVKAPKVHVDMTATVDVVNVGNADKAADMTVYCAYYSKADNKMVDVGLAPLTNVSARGVENVTVTMHSGYDANTVYARAFVWEDGSVSPLAASAELFETVAD